MTYTFFNTSSTEIRNVDQEQEWKKKQKNFELYKKTTYVCSVLNEV